jgi:hypothetical protein
MPVRPDRSCGWAASQLICQHLSYKPTFIWKITARTAALNAPMDRMAKNKCSSFLILAAKWREPKIFCRTYHNNTSEQLYFISPHLCHSILMGSTRPSKLYLAISTNLRHHTRVLPIENLNTIFALLLMYIVELIVVSNNFWILNREYYTSL